MKPKIEQEWYFCDDCDDWVGSTPPNLPYLWSNRKAAGNHTSGTGHKPQKITWDQIAIPQKEDKDEARS